MAINQKQSLWIAAIIVVLLIVGGLIWKKTTKHTSYENTTPSSSTELQADKGDASELSQSQALEGKTLEGTLKVSNDSKKGNLMLISPTSTVYISTSRDFGSLLDKQVKVQYDGTPGDFRLGDITAK